MKTQISLVGKTKKDGWECRQWLIDINGESFNFFTGMGIKSAPSIDDILESLFLESDSSLEPFDWFCDSLGYEQNSLKAFKAYLECIETRKKLKRALGSEYEKEKSRIQNRE
jgi:hypothetical protein